MKKVLRVALSIFIIAIYITGIAVLLAQALTPGSESSNISQNFGDRLDEVVTEIQKPEITEVRVSDIGISSITVSDEKYTDSEIGMYLGETGKIKCRITPEDATNKSLSYTSSDDSIVLAYPDGRIVAKALGSATVTVTSLDNPGLTDTVKVTVTSLPIEGISIAEPGAISVGEKIRLELEFIPKNTTEKSVLWHSSNPDVLSVDKSGTVTAKSEGEATITVTSTVNNQIVASITVKVDQKKEIQIIPPESVSIKSQSQIGRVGSTLKLSAELYPAGAEAGLIWHSSDESVATISQKGVLTCHKAGEVTVTVSCGDGIESSIRITVKEVLSKNIDLDFDDISHTEEGGYVLKQGSSGKVIATLDEGATILSVTFASSDENVAKISGDGVITALKGGTTTITVSTSYDGETTEVSFDLTVDPITLKDTMENFYYWVRKSMGHFGAFLVLGIFAALSYFIIFKKTLKGKLLAFLVTLVAGFAVAGITEILQLPYFTAGRYCSFDDVLLDFYGYCTSTIPIFVLIIVLHFVSLAVKAIKNAFKPENEN